MGGMSKRVCKVVTGLGFYSKVFTFYFPRLPASGLRADPFFGRRVVFTYFGPGAPLSPTDTTTVNASHRKVYTTSRKHELALGFTYEAII
jgi:hypothetical protein